MSVKTNPIKRKGNEELSYVLEVKFLSDTSLSEPNRETLLMNNLLAYSNKFGILCAAYGNIVKILLFSAIEQNSDSTNEEEKLGPSQILTSLTFQERVVGVRRSSSETFLSIELESAVLIYEINQFKEKVI